MYYVSPYIYIYIDRSTCEIRWGAPPRTARRKAARARDLGRGLGPAGLFILYIHMYMCIYIYI